MRIFKLFGRLARRLERSMRSIREEIQRISSEYAAVEESLYYPRMFEPLPTIPEESPWPRPPKRREGAANQAAGGRLPLGPELNLVFPPILPV